MSLSRILANIGTALDSATTGDFLSKVDSDGVFGGVAYSSVTGTPTVLDSANITNLIDSAYIQLRQTAVASGGLDSAGVTAILDSDYITNITTASGFQMFEYDATAGQTVFTGSDVNGNTLAYSEYGLLVHYNGILLSGATDYTATDGTTVVLTDSADADARITIAKWSLASAGGGGSAAATWYGDRGLWAGGDNYSTTIDYIDISTPGNATDFGDLAEGTNAAGALSDTTYGVFMGGLATGAVYLDTLQYVTISTTSNTTDFGDLTMAKLNVNGCCDGTTGIALGGYTSSTGRLTDIEYFTVASPSNATDFGDLTVAAQRATCTDGTYGIGGGGYDTTRSNVVEYITIASPSNATDFGDLTVARSSLCAVSDTTYGVFAGGQSISTTRTNIIDYITIASPSNATDFGDLTQGYNLFQGTGAANSTTGVIGGGYAVNGSHNSLEYITIVSPSNATDFGDLTINQYRGGGCSGSPS